jgi:hypothetical protein
MTEGEEKELRSSKTKGVRRVLSQVLLTIVAMLVAYGGIKFWAETLDSCEQEGNSYAYCLLTMRYQAAKEIFKH